MNDIINKAKFTLAAYTALGFSIVGLGWITHSSFMSTMGVIVVLLGGLIKLTIIQNHIIKLMKLNGTWKNEAVQPQKSSLIKQIEKNQAEKSASELIEDQE